MKPVVGFVTALSLVLSLPSVSFAMQATTKLVAGPAETFGKQPATLLSGELHLEPRMRKAEKTLADINDRVKALEKQMQDLVEGVENNKKNVIPVSEEQKERMESWFELGKNHYDQQNYHQAWVYFQKVIGENQEAENEMQTESANLLGKILLYGKVGVAKDFVRACTYFIKVKNEDAPLWEKALLGYRAYVDEDYKTAMECFDTLQAQNNNEWLKVWAVVRRAIVCLKSAPVEPDQESRRYKDIFDLLLAIAKQTEHIINTEAQALAWAYIGKMYLEGKGVEKDPAAALDFLKRAASQDESKVAHIVAQTAIGTMHRQGVGVQKDPVQARKQYHAAIGEPERRCILL